LKTPKEGNSIGELLVVEAIKNKPIIEIEDNNKTNFKTDRRNKILSKEVKTLYMMLNTNQLLITWK